MLWPVTVLALLLAFGATARLTRLVTTDVFPPTVALRARVLAIGVRRHTRPLNAASGVTRTDTSLAVDKTRSWWPYKLLTCGWCLSFWIGLAAVTVAYFQPRAWWFLLPAAALTASHITGLLSRLD